MRMPAHGGVAPGSRAVGEEESGDEGAGIETVEAAGGGGSDSDEGGERTSAELMSAQALFGGSIPGLTSFGKGRRSVSWSVGRAIVFFLVRRFGLSWRRDVWRRPGLGCYGALLDAGRRISSPECSVVVLFPGIVFVLSALFYDRKKKRNTALFLFVLA